MRHNLDIYPIPEEVLYINELSLAENVPYETRDDMKKAVTGMIEKEGGMLPNDKVRIYVPLDLNSDIIMWQLYSLFGSLGHPSEGNESVYSSAVRKIISQLEIYDQVWSARNVGETVQKEDGGVRHMSVTSQFSGISVIQFSPIKTQKKQPKLQFYDI